jgi:hypothetical protein
MHPDIARRGRLLDVAIGFLGLDLPLAAMSSGLRALTVELGLGDVARVREPAWIAQAGGEHRGDEGHGAATPSS